MVSARGGTVTRHHGHSVEIDCAAVRVELSAVNDEVFRLRMTRRRGFALYPTCAVLPQSKATVKSEFREKNGIVSLSTPGGTLWFDLRHGSWGLLDAVGTELFVSPPGETGFQGDDGKVTLSLRTGEAVFGLGESTGPFNKRGLIREFWNTDVLGHAPAIHPALRSLYISIPFALSLRAGNAAGFFWDNSRRQQWDIGQTCLDRWEMTCARGAVDLYLFPGPGVASVIESFGILTGRMPLPPLWALGYHQCRYSYETRRRVEEVAAEFRRRQIPCDAIYIDIHYMDEYRVFTFGRRFPLPASMIQKLARKGFKVVAIIDPGVKEDAAFAVWQRGIALDAFVKTAGGKEDYVGAVWPGPSRFPDFLNAKVRRWWAEEQRDFGKVGLAGYWNDMNEPANFALPAKTLPEDTVHRGDAGKLRHRQAHNLYGMAMAQASREGALLAHPNERPFIITRAGYAGVQRHALVWTGDNSSTWEALADSLQMLLNLSMSGVAFCGSDVGGFLENCTPELLVR